MSLKSLIEELKVVLAEGQTRKQHVSHYLDLMSKLADQQTASAHNIGVASAFKTAAKTHLRVVHAAKRHGRRDLVDKHGEAADKMERHAHRAGKKARDTKSRATGSAVARAVAPDKESDNETRAPGAGHGRAVSKALRKKHGRDDKVASG